ncbi:hypothetical protein AVEN_131597-1 [Araneus ventricosus]|uniref:Uncharacterized protein n=1 Tax=Araneus ventricosus TaxID=182803 RepID=A0A4Y2EWC2_ARAVE|nr:hypothetical protein AVEN_131597-1 [Araneus ventricosus]
MSWQCLFLLCNKRPLWHFHPKEASFITVEDLLEATFIQSLDVDTHFSAPNLSKFAPLVFVFAKLEVRSHGTPTKSESNDENPRQNFQGKNRRKQKPKTTETEALLS